MGPVMDIQTLITNFLNSDELQTYILNLGLRLLSAIAILLLGLFLSGRLARRVRRAANRNDKIAPMVGGFMASLVKYGGITITLIIVLGQFGIEMTVIIAILTAASLAVGLALQGTLSNFAAGFMIMIFRPFRVGDYVEIASTGGTVKEVGLFSTELASPNNIQIIVPNNTVWGAEIRNYSFHNTRRLDLTFGISYSDDIGKALGVIRRLAEADERVLADPEAQVFVLALGDSSVDLSARIWCKRTDYGDLKWALTRAVKEAFDAENITIPFPTTTVIQAKS